MNFPRNFSRPIAERLRKGEDVLALAAFFTMAILPCVEVVAYLFGTPRIPASSVIVRHMTLWIGFLGAILAARQGRLLAFTRPGTFTEGKKSRAMQWFASSVAMGVTLTLAWASLRFVISEMDSPTNVLPGIPIWIVQVIMPVGFLLIAIQIFLKSGKNPVMRGLMLAIVVMVGLIGLGETMQTPLVVWLGFASLVVALVFGAPIFIGLGGAAVLLFWYTGVSVSAIPIEMYRIVVSPTLPTIPLFTLAGYILAEGGASRRLVEVFRHWFGWIPGGTPVLVTFLCGFFTALTGGSGVTILALGGLLLPMLLAEKYPLRFSIGLITVSGSLGLLFPPSLPAIIYGVKAGVAINKIFLAGILPGLFLVLLVAFWGVRQGYVSGVHRTPFEPKKAFSALWKAKWEVLLPVVILAGIFGGFATLVEVAALLVIYTLVVEAFIYKDLKLNAIPGVILNCATLVGGVLIIIGVAMGLTSFLVDAQVPMLALDWVKANIRSEIVFLLILNVFLLLAGCLMDIFSAIIVVVPLIAPMGAHFGLDPVHLAIIFIANLELGFLTPPVGMNLFLSAYRFDKSMPEIYKATLPFFLIRVLGVLAITYAPILWASLLGDL